MMRRGSALLMALWVILTLSVVVLSFAFEAKLQGGINIYVQGKNRVKRLIDAGRILGEVVIVGCADSSIKQASGDETEADRRELLEDDRWYLEKRDLLYNGAGCVIGPILLDEDDAESGTVKVEISMASADTTSGININTLCKDEDSNFEDRWHIILDRCGVPRGEVTDDDGHLVNLQNYIIACWQDYRDSDDVIYSINDSQAFKGAQGAEKSDYEEYYDDHKKDYAEEDRFEPANGEITTLTELARVLCFRKFPAVLTGGVLNPEAKNDKDAINIPNGLIRLGILGVTGDGKVNVNRCTVDQLMTVPGIYDIDEIDEDEKSESLEIAEAIVKCRKLMPRQYDVPEDKTEWGYGEYASDWWADLTQRVADEFDLEIPSEAKNYLCAVPDKAEGALFRMKITVSLMEMSYTAEGECYLKDKKLRYVSWKEN